MKIFPITGASRIAATIFSLPPLFGAVHQTEIEGETSTQTNLASIHVAAEVRLTVGTEPVHAIQHPVPLVDGRVGGRR